MVNNQNVYKKERILKKTQLKITALYRKNNAREKSLSGMVFNSEIIVLHGISSELHPLSASSFLLVTMDCCS